MSRLSLLVAHPWMARGGSEATAVWTVEALQDEHDVTFATAPPVDWESLNLAYGSRVKQDRIRMRRSPVLPGVDGGKRLVSLHQRRFEKFCHGIADEYDLCISAYNPIYFGRPAIQLIGDFSFSEEMRKRLYIHGRQSLRHRSSWFRRCYLELSDLIGVRRPELSAWGDLILANSDWSARQLELHFGIAGAEVIYPPVILPTAPAGGPRDPLGFVCLGRVVPEKEIERIIGILARVREEGYPVTLQLIGNLDDSSYSRAVAVLLGRYRDWISPHGFLNLEEKQEVLAGQTFALHACRIEAFGIAVAEMASMGCIPFVPDTGGAGEIVAFPELQYGSDDEAVGKILALLRLPGRVAELRGALPGQVGRFGPGIFMKDLREFVRKFSEDRLSV